MDFREQCVVVTGGASGIGLAMAREMASRGARVIISDIHKTALYQAAQDTDLIPFACDVSKPESVGALAEFAASRFPKIDVLCNNAGVGPGGAFSDLTLEDWHWILDINLFGVIHGMHFFLPLLESNPDGAFILNTASALAFSPPPPMMSPYVTSKFAIAGLTEAFNLEAKIKGSKVRAGVLAPGPVLTNIAKSTRPLSESGRSGFNSMTEDMLKGMEAPLQRWLEPEEVARHAVNGILARQGNDRDAQRESCSGEEAASIDREGI